MIKKRFILAGLAIALWALISAFPLTWVGSRMSAKMGDINPSYAGTIWDGVIRDIPGLSPLFIQTHPSNLLRGEAPISFSSQQAGLSLSGQAGFGGNVDLKAEGAMSYLASIESRLAGLAGNFTLDLVDMRLTPDQCLSGEGRVTTDILTRNKRRWQWSGPPLKGDLYCEGGDVIVKLKGEQSGETITSDLRLRLKGDYNLDILFVTSDYRVGLFLPVYGFEATDNGYKLIEAGNWK